jgi:DNA topoisomerase-6 subunit A
MTKVVEKEEVIKRLEAVLKNILAQLLDHQIPNIMVKNRSKNNLLRIEGVWALGDQKYVKKTLKTSGGAKQTLKLVRAIEYLLNQLKSNKTSTLREFYYNALNWIQLARFEKVNDSNLCLQNLEVMLDLVREEFNIYPNEEGRVSGPIVLEYITRKGQKKEIDCVEDVSNGFLLPRSIKDLKVIKHDAKFVLVLETGGLFARLIEQNFDTKYGAILVHTGGQPSRMTRLFIKELNVNHNLPVAIFNDGDPAGFRIARSIIDGAIKSSHLSQRLCTPDAVHIGLFPSQIKQYNLPTDKITPLEKEALTQLKSDPRYLQNQTLLSQIDLMAQNEKKAEQQSLSYYGLSYVADEFLPSVLKRYNIIKEEL